MQAAARLSGFGAGTDSLLITLFSGGLAAGNRIFQLTLTRAANGWTSGSTTTILNPGRDSVSTTTGWHLEVTHNVTSGGASQWNDILVECYYTDYVPYIRGS
jgi:hypothetical protein